MGHRHSDLLVRLAGCWTGAKCEGDLKQSTPYLVSKNAQKLNRTTCLFWNYLQTRLSSVTPHHTLFVEHLLITNTPRPSNDTGNRARSDDCTRRRSRNRRTRRPRANETAASTGDLARSSQAQRNVDTANGESKVKLALAHGKLSGAGSVIEGVGRHWVIVSVVGAV
jgi:hypothetical protein